MLVELVPGLDTAEGPGSVPGMTRGAGLCAGRVRAKPVGHSWIRMPPAKEAHPIERRRRRRTVGSVAAPPLRTRSEEPTHSTVRPTRYRT